MSTKVLSQRLKELIKDKIVEKRISSITPVLIEYMLTPRGEAFNKVLFEMAKYAIDQFSDEVFNHLPENTRDAIRDVEQIYLLKWSKKYS